MGSILGALSERESEERRLEDGLQQRKEGLPGLTTRVKIHTVKAYQPRWGILSKAEMQFQVRLMVDITGCILWPCLPGYT